MHRQSLGSPASKHGVLFAGDGVITTDINSNFTPDDLQTHRKDKLPSCSAVLSSSTRLVHLIPVLTFVCFLILYLSSHDPSRTDLAQFSGFTTISSKKTVIGNEEAKTDTKVLMKKTTSQSAQDSIDMDDNIGGGFLKNMRNLQQEEAERHRFRLHRKLGQ